MKIPNTPANFTSEATSGAIESTWESGGFRRFGLKGRSDVVSCEVVLQSDILAYPERSSAHKALVAALGLNAAPEE